MTHADVLVVGELNVDLILNQVGSFPEIGKEKIAGSMDITLGSSSAIFASNLSSLGASVAFIGKTGKDQFGDLVVQSLKNKGVDVSLVRQCETLNTGATIIINFGEDRAMITHPGAMDHLALEDIPLCAFSTARHLHFSSYFLQREMQKNVVALFRHAKDAGLTTSFDPQYDPHEKWDIDLAGLLPFVDVFLPNEKELCSLTGRPTVQEGVHTLKNLANIIGVKLGNKGSVVWQNGVFNYMDPFLNEHVEDAIGAGDSFNAGFIYKFLLKAPLQSCQEFGNLTGAISTTRPGGTTAFSSYDDMMKIAKDIFGYDG